MNTEVADFANYNYKVFITNTLRDTEIISQLKNLIQPIIQNSGGDLRVATEILTTENATEVKNIINRIQEQKEAKEEQMQKSQQEQQMQMQQIQIQAKQEEMKMQKQIADDRNAVTLKAAELNAQRLERANDIDQDGTNDLIQLQMEKNENESNVELNDAKIAQIQLQNKKIETEIQLMKKKGKKE